MAKKLLMGNEAFACAALEAGVGVVAGYPGTPSSELIETVAARVVDGSAQGVHVEWSTNEKAALELLAGASYAGARTLFTCKQVGLNVASDPLMSLNYVGIEGGCVLYVADDPGPISSQTEQDTRRFASFAKVPVLDPADVEQGMEMMRAAFDLSERYRTPVIVRATTRVCHSSTFVEVQELTHARPAQGFKKDDNRWVIFPSRAYRGHLEVNERLKWIEAEFSGDSFDGTDAQLQALQQRKNIALNPSVDLNAEQLLPEVAAGLSEWGKDGSRLDTLDSSAEVTADTTAPSEAPLKEEEERATFAPQQPQPQGSEAPLKEEERAALSGTTSIPPSTPPCDLSRFNPCETGFDSGMRISSAVPNTSQQSCETNSADLSDSTNDISNSDANPSIGVLGIACGGVSTAYVREALAIIAQEDATHERQRIYGSVPYRLFQVGTPFPFPTALANDFIAEVDRIVVFEELDHVIEDELVRITGLRAAEGLPVVRIAGRRTGDCPAAGENTVEVIAECLRQEFDRMELASQGITGTELKEELTQRHTARTREKQMNVEDGISVQLPARPPVLCAGCPHRGAFYAAKQAVRRMKVPAVLSGDIGCYTLGNAQPLDAVDTCLCMGAGITIAQGLGTVEPGVKQLAFVGDSTFFASGLTGIANAAYNGHDITICVLDNSTTAMTGGQPHPGIGRTLMGTNNKPLSIESVLQALGVQCIEHANPHHVDESIQAVMHAVSYEGLSAVIFHAPCVNLIKHGQPVTIDETACTGCKRCIKSIGCPAIGFRSSDQDASTNDSDASEVQSGSAAEKSRTNRKRSSSGVAVIDTTLCTGCGLCTQLCPFDCIKTANPKTTNPQTSDAEKDDAQ